MGFFLYEWRSHEYRKKNFLTNHEWLSRRDEIKIPHARRSRKWGIFILSQLLSHDVMSEEIYPSLFLSRPGVTFPFLEANFASIKAQFLKIFANRLEQGGNFIFWKKDSNMQTSHTYFFMF